MIMRKRKIINLILGTMTFGENVFPPEADKIVEDYLKNGGLEIDTAYVYNNGDCERLLGEILPRLENPYKISTKINPRISGKLDGEAAFKQLNESLERMKISSVDTVYLHFPDPNTPVDDVLSAMNILHDQGKYKEMGLSNFPAWMVSDIWHKCDKRGWVKPTVYEGLYNPLSRNAERELKACLDIFGMRFYAYNPTCGGLLSGKYLGYDNTPHKGRFIDRPNYKGRYWKKAYFDAIKYLKEVCDEEKISLVEATYRWMAFHSMLKESRGDGIIIGASKLEHLISNRESVYKGKLPESLVDAFEEAWRITRNDSPEYFTLYMDTQRLELSKNNVK